MEIRYLTQDIVSHTNRSNVYGVQGEKVSLITEGVGAKIVENDKGIRFSVKDEYLSLKPISAVDIPVSHEVDKVTVKAPKPALRQSKKPLTKAEKLQIEYLNSKK